MYRILFNMKNQTLTRKELYELVWTSSLSSLAKKYSITDVGLRKICIRMNIPLPEFGHWMKVKYNKPITKKPLPKNYTGETIIQLNRLEEGDNKIQGKLSVYNKLEDEITTKELDLLIVPETLTNPNPLIVASHEYYTKKKIQYGSKEYESLIKSTVNIDVSDDLLDRSLRIMDTLLKVIEIRGHKVIIKGRSTYVVIQDEEIEIKLREKLKRIPIESNYSWQQYDHVHSGILSFVMEKSFYQVVWQDGKIPLEKQLARIIARIEIKGEEKKQYKIACEKHRAERAEKERIAEQKRKRKEKEFSNVKVLFTNCKQWHESQVLRNYLDEYEAFATQNNKMTKKMKKWLTWARKKADWYDPFIAKRDKYLDEDDKEKLFTKKKLDQFGTNYY